MRISLRTQMGGVSLYPHQKVALDKLRTGSVLCGRVGSGKSLTAIAYYHKVCGGELDPITPPKTKKDLYVITTSKKRDTKDWEEEHRPFAEVNPESKLVVDSWNNIGKYSKVSNAFFIFDEQRVVGSGAWVKYFLKITKANDWILLSATPGDTWMDYIPVFVANGFYKNRTEFITMHVVYKPRYTKYPVIDRYVDTGRLLRLQHSILVVMPFKTNLTRHHKDIIVDHDKKQFELVEKELWNPFTDKPIKDVSEKCYLMRKVVNSDIARLSYLRILLAMHKKIIVFYNFDYELEILRSIVRLEEVTVAEHNGHKHEPTPNTDVWLYLVQYASGAEGWNCIETNAIVFYSLNYSYRTMVQAAGRIDRMNTTFSNLYYYYFKSNSKIDVAISKALSEKRSFNERNFS